MFLMALVIMMWNGKINITLRLATVRYNRSVFRTVPTRNRMFLFSDLNRSLTEYFYVDKQHMWCMMYRILVYSFFNNYFKRSFKIKFFKTCFRIYYFKNFSYLIILKILSSRFPTYPLIFFTNFLLLKNQ